MCSCFMFSVFDVSLSSQFAEYMSGSGCSITGGNCRLWLALTCHSLEVTATTTICLRLSKKSSLYSRGDG